MDENYEGLVDLRFECRPHSRHTLFQVCLVKSFDNAVQSMPISREQLTTSITEWREALTGKLPSKSEYSWRRPCSKLS